jgi:hypothetical protein
MNGELIYLIAVLFKPDRPRDIDRYIDYFGDSAAGAGAPPRCAVAGAQGGAR